MWVFVWSFSICSLLDRHHSRRVDRFLWVLLIQEGICRRRFGVNAFLVVVEKWWRTRFRFRFVVIFICVCDLPSLFVEDDFGVFFSVTCGILLFGIFFGVVGDFPN